MFADMNVYFSWYDQILLALYYFEAFVSNPVFV